MIEDEYYVKCFKKDVAEYAYNLNMAYRRKYRHLYSEEKINSMVYQDMTETFKFIGGFVSSINLS